MPQLYSSAVRRVSTEQARSSFRSLLLSTHRTMITHRGADIKCLVPPAEARALESLESSGALGELLANLPDSS